MLLLVGQNLIAKFLPKTLDIFVHFVTECGKNFVENLCVRLLGNLLIIHIDVKSNYFGQAVSILVLVFKVVLVNILSGSFTFCLLFVLIIILLKAHLNSLVYFFG